MFAGIERSYIPKIKQVYYVNELLIDPPSLVVWLSELVGDSGS